MSFDFSALITDRSQADLDALRGLLSTPMSDWTAEQLAAFNLAKSRGAYNYTDLNRVTAAMEALDGMLRAQGYESGYQKLVVNSSQSGGRLPEGYTELEYIQSSGNEYIDTDFKPNQDTRVVMDFQLISETAEQTPFLTRQASRQKSFGIFNNGTVWIADYGDERVEITDSIAITDRIYIDFNKNIILVNNVSSSAPMQIFATPSNLSLFARNTNGQISNNCIGKLYSCQIYDDGLLVRDFVPCIDPEGTVGLYDLAGGTFYGNSGTGAFTAGYTPKLLPDGSTELEWIQSDSTAYINTGFIPDSLSRIVMQIAVFPSSDWRAPFGARNTSNPSDETSNVLFFSPANFPRWDYYGSTYTLQDSVPIQEKIDIDLNQNVISVNNATHEFPAISASSDYPWLLFDVNTGGSPRESGEFRLYSCQIYDNGTLIRDFVPAKKSDGTIGLYDRVSGTVYTNAGTGAFTAGPVVPDFDTKDRINVTPTMTSNTTPSGYVASASSVHETRDAWRAFNGDNLEWHSGPGLPQWLQLQFPDAIRVDELCIRNPAADSYGTKGITTFSLLGSNDGASFDVLGEYTNNPGNGLCNCFAVSNPGTYKIYRIQITGTGYVFEGNPYCVITEATFYQNPEPEPEFDPYIWYEENIPTETLMEAYLANVNATWSTLLNDPDLPETMAGLTADGANRIEQALLTVLDFVERMAIDLFYCGEIVCGEV